MSKKLLFAIMALVLCVGLIGSAFAYFSDSVASNNNTFTAGTLSIDHAGIVGAATFNIPNMAPGDLTGMETYTIKNTGTLPLVWLGNWIITGPSALKSAIYINYADMKFLKADGTPWEDEDNFITNGVGSGSYPGWYNTLASENPYGVVGLDVWDGNNGMGTAPYEQVGILKPGDSYVFTVQFGFAAGAQNTLQGVGPLTVNLDVQACQVNATAIALVTGGFPYGDMSWLNSQLALQP